MQDEQPTQPNLNGKNRRKRSARSTVLRLILGVVVVLAVLVYFKWYQFAVSGDTPYDEIFTEINSRMPQPAKDFACAKIAERFPNTLPPTSCEPTG